MTRGDYECLRDRRRDLNLPQWDALWPSDFYWIRRIDEEYLVTHVTSDVLSGRLPFNCQIDSNATSYQMHPFP